MLVKLPTYPLASESLQGSDPTTLGLNSWENYWWISQTYHNPSKVRSYKWIIVGRIPVRQLSGMKIYSAWEPLPTMMNQDQGMNPTCKLFP